MPSTVGLYDNPLPPASPPVDPTADIEIAGDGNVTIPAALAARLGLRPQDGLVLSATSTGVHISSDSLRRVYVEVTGVCNLTCVTCVRQTWTMPGSQMPLERYRSWLAGLPVDRLPELTLKLGGFGEPLTHPGLTDMVCLARERGVGVEIISNGTLLTPAMSTQLLHLGVAQVTVSLDGAGAASYANVRGAALGPVLANVVALLDARRRVRAHMRVGLAFVAMRRNIAGLPGLLALGRELHVDFLSISNLVPHTAEMARETLWSRAAWEAGFALQDWGPRVALGRMDHDESTRRALAALWKETAVVPPSFAPLATRPPGITTAPLSMRRRWWWPGMVVSRRAYRSYTLIKSSSTDRPRRSPVMRSAISTKKDWQQSGRSLSIGLFVAGCAPLTARVASSVAAVRALRAMPRTATGTLSQYVASVYGRRALRFAPERAFTLGAFPYFTPLNARRDQRGERIVSPIDQATLSGAAGPMPGDCRLPDGGHLL